MAWTAPRTWVVGEIPTAATFNTHVRDNLLWLHDSQPAALVYNSVVQSVNSATWTTLSFDSEVLDNDTMHDGANPTRLTATTAGTYIVFGIVQFENAAWDAVGARLLAVGAVTNELMQTGTSTQTGGLVIMSMYVNLAAGNYAELAAWQNSGSAKNALGSTTTGCRFAMYRICA